MSSMNKRELARAVSVQSDVDFRTVNGVLESFTDVVTSVVSKGEPVSISGFAKFVKVDRPARMGRNPATGEAIQIKASKKARITPVKAFKDAVMNPSRAPKLKRGSWPTSDEAVKAAGKSLAAAPVRKAASKTTATARKATKKSATTRKTAKSAKSRRPAAKKTTRRR
jgi:DNA-binding protein HU-beta